MTDTHLENVRKSYDGRAPTYDNDWHTMLGLKFVEWLKPRPGEIALDLACGTGLVTIPLAKAVGPSGRVVGIDIAGYMVKHGKTKLSEIRQGKQAGEYAHVDWYIDDIASERLLSLPAVEKTVVEHGGFDITSCCSALVLLHDPDSVIHFWASKLLKKGGRFIVDVVTEDINLQFLMTYYLPRALGDTGDLVKGRLWVQNKYTLPNALRRAGLSVEMNMPTRSQTGERWYKGDEETAIEVLDKAIREDWTAFGKTGKIEEAHKAWPELWKLALITKEDGSSWFVDGNWLYVCIGRK